MRKFTIKNRQKRKYIKKNKNSPSGDLYRSASLSLIPLFFIVAAVFSSFILLQTRMQIPMSASLKAPQFQLPSFTFPPVLSYVDSISTDITLDSSVLKSFVTQATTESVQTFNILSQSAYGVTSAMLKNISPQPFFVFAGYQLNSLSSAVYNTYLNIVDFSATTSTMLMNIMINTVLALTDVIGQTGSTQLQHTKNTFYLLSQFVSDQTALAFDRANSFGLFIQERTFKFVIDNLIFAGSVGNKIYSAYNFTNAKLYESRGLQAKIFTNIYNGFYSQLFFLRTIIISSFLTIANLAENSASAIQSMFTRLIAKVEVAYSGWLEDISPLKPFYDRLSYAVGDAAASMLDIFSGTFELTGRIVTAQTGGDTECTNNSILLASNCN